MSRRGFPTLRASCPARIDIGNSLDHPSFFYSLASQSSLTANIAVELRTSVAWSHSGGGGIRFAAADVQEDHKRLTPRTVSRFPILCALLRHFEIDNGIFEIATEVPRGSGLGGSGMLLMAALALIQTRLHGKPSRPDYPSLALTAHLFENWLGYSSTGFQDQLATLYGGGNNWIWGTHLDARFPFFKRVPLSPPGGVAALEKHLLLCFTGQVHPPTRMSQHIGALPAKDLRTWEMVNQRTEDFANAVNLGDWGGAAANLDRECDLRRSLEPARISPRARTLIAAARACGLGARFAGHGHGGCVWACGPEAAVSAGMEQWKALARRWKSAWVIAPRIARRGMVVEQ